MSELMIRCPSCRGAKKVPKLGGIIGKCNLCKGDGEIKESLKPVAFVAPVEIVPAEVAKEVEAVAPVVFDNPDLEQVKLQVETVKAPSIKDIQLTAIEKKGLDQQRRVYKRKTKG